MTGWWRATMTAGRWPGIARGALWMPRCPISRPCWSATSPCRMGARARPVFHLMAERYLGAEYAPEAVAERCGVPAERIRRLAAEIAHVAFEQPVVLDQPWTDTYGRRHERMVGRPVSFHAMRGISAHSNGFHTCRALHLLQMLLGAVDTPGSWRYKSPFPRPIPPGARPGRQGREAEHAASRQHPLLPARAGRPAGGRGGRAAAHRQGVLLGSAARPARDDAHRHRQCRRRRSLSDRHACSCSWPTWPGTAP